VIATVHPSSLLRMPDEKNRHAEMERFIEDLKKVGRLLKRSARTQDARTDIQKLAS